jgi:microsomal dipeptidase-like Zn-dependent dipeptidase
MKKIVKVLFAFIAIYLLFIIIAPSIIDKMKNPTVLKSPYKVSNSAQKIYNSLPFIADMHCDALLWDRNLLDKKEYGHVDIPRMLEVNVSIQAFTIVTKSPKGQNFSTNTGDSDNITTLMIAQGQSIKSWSSLTERALIQAKNLHKFEEKSAGKFRIIKSKSDLKKYLVDTKLYSNITAGFLGVEGAHALDGKLGNIAVLFDEGVRMMSPTHFFDNKLGGSAHGISKAGLTDFGKKVIEEMQSKHMIVDVAHASPKVIDAILAMTTKPIVSSHTGVKGTCDNVRNLSDKHIKGIANSGGLVSIAMFKQAVCGTDVKATAVAIKYVIDLVGSDFVALGSDFDGSVNASVDITGFPLIVEELLKLEVSEIDIQKVMGENVKRLLLESLPE